MLVLMFLVGCDQKVMSPKNYINMNVACENYGGVESFYITKSQHLNTYCYDGSTIKLDYIK